MSVRSVWLMLMIVPITLFLPASREQVPNCQDEANLARYRSANAALPALAPGEARIVFYGDSITDQWLLSGSFPDRPAYVNRGIAGQTTPQLLIRFRADVIDVHATTVVILAGINDIGRNSGTTADAEAEANLASMSELATAHGIRVVLTSVLPVSNYHGQVPPYTTQYPLARITAMNAWIAAYAAAHGHAYADYFAAMVDSTGVMREDLTADDLHPNAKGYAAMAPVAETALAHAIGEGR